MKARPFPKRLTVLVLSYVLSFVPHFSAAQTDTTVQIPVGAGWSLLSLPLSLEEEQSPEKVFPTADSVLAYRNNRYVTVDSLVIGEGYWVFHSAPSTVRFEGVHIGLKEIEVELGWNLVGSISSPSPIVDLVNNSGTTVVAALEYRQG
ncbi:hypothetical protein GWO43_27680, partial [candidate division KSB1 bacterium]|nr:hypothetical protein [candidate division KSB1 bacterium]NIV70250.1 hypothetical protein [Phycisphaerae bacterium]NIR71649.1 hypothetical protein [candidate division KSB1 bacterium]NIT74574.1 hypothetical protein [candidate division KSB1 bacterium]NIU24072.1 hypothetical protein [candidate division KSB1 bacterium]